MEEDDETCKQDCRRWEEDIYWTHFRSIHFFQFLRGDFQKQLAMPKKFAENMKNKLGENVFLKGPSGSIWKVGLAAEEGGLFFKRGWEEFVKDHPLAENDVLMFRFSGNSRFEVLMFDQRSLCEKEASYFCKKWGQNEKESEAGMKRKAREGSEVVTESPLPQDAVRAPAEEQPQKEEETAPAATRKKGRRIVTPRRASLANVGKESSLIVIDQDKKRSPVKSPSASSTPPQKGKVTRRRSVHKDSGFTHVFVSKKNAAVKSPAHVLMMQRAQAAMKSESFSVVMQPTHPFDLLACPLFKLYNLLSICDMCQYLFRNYQSIPVQWADKHLGRCHQNIILRVKDKTWKTRYNYTSRNCGGISGGWRSFALDNYLQESDVCLFDLGDSIDGTVVLDVTIFRAIESVIPAVPEASAPPAEGPL
ncbi:hypothetical protein CRG98_030953 [Punica granatum]|uniref:TF-B3 domain-containing protein n=1 Tax=Punica granatum TaxID=22663 RepID=A0A2I0IZ05_PUNGR|nr:hypothetical protein CRG98_030953 [Punica granatum]